MIKHLSRVVLFFSLALGVCHGEALKLKSSPRLWVSEDLLDDLPAALHSPYLKRTAENVLADADWLVTADPISEGEARSYQHGTRAIASHLQCLTAAWVLTKDPKYRRAAIRHMENILTWNQISCEARPGMSADRDMFFCLSYGEHAADIGFMYDVFRPDLTPDEKKVFFAVLDRFYLKEALESLEAPPWWVNKSWSNWNGVCAGGIGIMALAFYDDRPECRALIPFVEESLGEYFKSFIENGGGCHEGTGYWNYGMHYAMRYVLSWEHATGKQHPALEIPEIAKSLHFPVDFTGITFGDNDGWHPTGVFFKFADRVNQPEAAVRAAAFLRMPSGSRTREKKRLSRRTTGDILYGASCMPSAEEMAALQTQREQKKVPLTRIYDGLDWAVLADDSVFPTLRLSVRGGSSRITGHGHLDLLSIKCMVNGQRMIEDQRGGSPVNFTPFGHHLYSRRADAKSTLFVDGLGCRENAVCEVTEIVRDGDMRGIRVEGSRVYMPRWRGGLIVRLVLMVENRYWLVIDTAPGHRMESRFHTYATVRHEGESARLSRGGEPLSMTFAALGGGVVQQSRGMPTSPQGQTRILRWIGRRPSHQSLHVTALNPGADKLVLNLRRNDDRGYAIEVKGADEYQRVISLTHELKLR